MQLKNFSLFHYTARLRYSSRTCWGCDSNCAFFHVTLTWRTTYKNPASIQLATELLTQSKLRTHLRCGKTLQHYWRQILCNFLAAYFGYLPRTAWNADVV